MDNGIAVKKIIEKVDNIKDYVKDTKEYTVFVSNKMMLEACVFNLGQIGELANVIDDDYKTRYPKVEWKKMYGLRNRIVHDYDGVNKELIWEIITEDLDKLKEELQGLSD